MSTIGGTGTDAPELLAAGTDLMERRRSGVSRGLLLAVPRTPESTRIAWGADGAARIGAGVTIAALAADPSILAGYPVLAAAAAGLATPQVRAVATVGGNLAQRSRCWYYRNPHTSCLKKGGATCPARDGNHLYGVIFDLGPCVAPHPSTLAAALLAHAAIVATDRRSGVTIDALLGDGADGTRDHMLAPGERIDAIQLPPPVAGERGGYRRAISRTHAEWPLVEVAVRLVVSDGEVRLARVAAGGVAPVPIRLPALEAALQGGALVAARIGAAARASCDGARPLPMTTYKLALLEALITDVLTAAGQAPVG